MSDSSLLQQWSCMRAAAQRLTGSVHDAEDAASEATIKLLKRRVGEVERPAAYAARTAERVALDGFRSRRRGLAREVRYIVSEVGEEDFTEVIARRDEARWAAELAGTLLKPVPHEILRRVGDEESVAAIAADLGLSTRAVESHLLRARRVLRTAIARGIAALLGLLAILRRPSQAALPTALAAASTVLVLAPHYAHSEAVPTTSLPAVEMPAYTGQLDTGTDVAPSPTATAREVRSLQARPATDNASPVARTKIVDSPVVGISSYEQDDGVESENVVERYLNCAENLSVTTTGITCADKRP